MRSIARTMARVTLAGLLALAGPLPLLPATPVSAVGCAQSGPADDNSMRKSWVLMEADVVYDTYMRVLQPDGTYRTAGRKVWVDGLAGRISVLLCVSKRNGSWGVRLWSDGKKVAEVKPYDYLGITDELKVTDGQGFALIPQWVTTSAITVHPTMCHQYDELLSLVLGLPLPTSYLVGVGLWVAAGAIPDRAPECKSFAGSGGISMPFRFSSTGDTTLSTIARVYTFPDDVPCKILPDSVNPPSTGTCYLVERYTWTVKGT